MGGSRPDEFDGNAFVCEPAGNLIKRNIVTAANGTIACREAYDRREFLASTDERFRPVNLYTGPEGALYIVDLYRGVLQHRVAITTYLRRYIEDRSLDRPLHRGRIWRIVPEGTTALVKPQLHKQAPAQWVRHLSHANSWWRETAQRLLVEHDDSGVVPALQRLARKGENPLDRFHALWTLDGTNRLDEATALAATQDHDSRVRAAAVRVSERFLKGEHRTIVLARLVAMTVETAPFVQQQLALTLGEAADPGADVAIATLVRRAPGTAFLQDAALSGLAGRELALLEHLLADPEWQKPDWSTDRFIGSLAHCVFASRNSLQIERLLTLLLSEPDTSSRRVAILDGILQSKSATTKKPVKLRREPAALGSLANSNDSRIASITALMTWPGKPGTKPEPPVVPLTKAQQARYEMGKVLFSSIYAACHQSHGLGLEGVAPPLVDAEWVTGSEERLVRIVLHGVTGPLSVKGRGYRLDMPALGALNDEQISGILTYIRREWEHTAAPIEPETVKAIRFATKDRHEAWLQEQLLEIP